LRGREGEAWRIVGWESKDLHLVVADDGRERAGERVVVILCLETGEVDYEYVRHLDTGEESGWERVC
jgi:hypothetical protein